MVIWDHNSIQKGNLIKLVIRELLFLFCACSDAQTNSRMILQLIFHSLYPYSIRLKIVGENK